MNGRWAAFLPVLLLNSGCIEARHFQDDAAGGSDSQTAITGQGGGSGAGFAAEAAQAGAETELSECLPGPDGRIAEGCVRGASLAAGDGFNCGLLAAGGIYCWGNDSDGQVTGAPETGDFISVAAGRRHACALRPDGTLQCWGNNSQQQAPADAAGEFYGHFKSVACGDDFTCGVHLDGTPLCFGSSAHGKINPPEGKYLVIATGADTACGVRSDSRVVCWGDDTWGIVSSAKGGVFKTVAVGPEHACAIGVERQMVCWGNGDSSAGDGVGATRTDVRPGSYLAVSAGGTHTAAITVGDHFTCFGDLSASAQCTSLTSAENFGAWYQVAAGRLHTCILGDPQDSSGPNGSVECFGRDRGSSQPGDRVFKSGR
ncbi:MAG TPA: hypothetical protein VFK05_01860 [Polyangiaceae bacterium]|nr:hypothetical protein [Polyangiaceae bacterium]